MKREFFRFFDAMTEKLKSPELFTAYFNGEISDFVRFNKGRIRQPGGVSQRHCDLTLVNGQRQASLSICLTGDFDEDLRRGMEVLHRLRDWIQFIPDDPHLCLPDTVNSTERLGENRLPESKAMVDDILAQVTQDDMVGILATGSIGCGFASSTGQKNWFTAHPFSLDWCLYHQGDKAVQSTYSGFDWDVGQLEQKMKMARQNLSILTQPTRKVTPGEYRAYLTPTAVSSLVELCAWGGFSTQATQIGMSPLLLLSNGEKSFDDRVSISENLEAGVAEDFQENGFTRPGTFSLIADGKMAGTLCSPRTAVEYGLENNGASGAESPCALDMAAGDIPQAEVLERLGTGLYVSNLWYLNYSDRSAGRMTGMTRFATLWVENGKAVAPVDPMRFDETIYRALGDNLIGLTQEREFSLSTSTYMRRSTNSTRVPGALIDTFLFTL